MLRELQDILEEAVRVGAEPGELPGVMAYPMAGQPSQAALIVGPHPLMGGRLENNVVRGLGRALAEHGWLTLRFEFSAAGASAGDMDRFWSTGQAPEDARRAMEARAALSWLARMHEDPILLIGYSFGASLLAELVDQQRLCGLVLIGATLTRHDFSRIAASRLPKLLLTADNDFATPLETTRAWYDAAAGPKRLVIVPAAEHFYRGREETLAQEILDWMPD
jgi:alpha/beta superfamily hydrolase